VSVPRSSTKQLVRDVAEKLPADATVEDAMERLYLLAKIERGIAQADAGETLSHEEVRARLGL
jgi:predicted transcriptional regulator